MFRINSLYGMKFNLVISSNNYRNTATLPGILTVNNTMCAIICNVLRYAQNGSILPVTQTVAKKYKSNKTLRTTSRYLLGTYCSLSLAGLMIGIDTLVPCFIPISFALK